MLASLQLHTCIFFWYTKEWVQITSWGAFLFQYSKDCFLRKFCNQLLTPEYALDIWMLKRLEFHYLLGLLSILYLYVICFVQIFTLVTREITMSLFLQVLCSKRFLYVRCKLRLNTYISGQLISDYIFIHKKI